MDKTPKENEKVKSIKKYSHIIYPLIIIVSIPLLLVFNTFWNLRTFNRDVNYLIRHEAVSIADTLKSIVITNIDDLNILSKTLSDTANANEDIVNISILSEENRKISIVSSSSSDYLIEDFEKTGLNQFSLGFDQPFAGLSYDVIAKKNVWNVSVPLSEKEGKTYILFLKLGVEKVDEILARTTKDSYVILFILLAAVLVLLTNHFLFYQKAQRARQLEEIDKLKDEFLSMAAHELRTPITAVIGYLELLQDKISPTEVQKISSDLALLRSLTTDLRNLIEELLDVSRIEQGRIKCEITSVDLNKLIGEVVATITPQATGKHLTINYQKPVENTFVNADRNRLRQVLTNLIGNSVKYSLQGTVEVLVEIKDKFVQISVKDNGIGIPPEELPKLFSKFHRVQDKKTAEVRGTGLGLWITKQIVEIMGGKISVESIYGTGSRFTFTVPLAGN